MKKLISLSLLTFTSLYASELQLDTIDVEATTLSEVAQKAQTSADVAQTLSDNIPSIDMNRRSGIANDILIRGQKRDNISIDVDGTKIYGACPNRMDPAISHIVANQIESIKVVEGPFDVTNFGTLSGGVLIETKQPSQEEQGEVNLGFGSFNYKKFGATGTGGNETLRLSITASTESSDQYKDGDGNTLAQQVENYAGDNTALQGVKYKPQYEDMQAYSKKSAMIKASITTAKNQELRLSYTANRSDNVLYANSKMDALWDDSNLYSIAYNIDNINDIYKNINLKYYSSDVDHPMATKYRMASNNTMMDNTNHLTTKMQGLKLKNSLEIEGYKLLIGFDASQREWDGRYYNTTTLMPKPTQKSIDDAQTDNLAIFATLQKHYGAVDITAGVRYDDTTISHATYVDRDFSGLNLSLFSAYNFSSENRLFLGIGQASRVPDARELYFTSVKGNMVGTPTLDQTTNSEIDFGYEGSGDAYDVKIKLFYSQLQDYIYIKKGVMSSAFSNIDATIYGAEFSGAYYLGDALSFDFSAAYKRGEKKEALSGQSDLDLADIAPLRGSVALNYEYMSNSLATIELKASDKWSDYDADNGEQELAAWSIINMKVKHAINRKFDFTIGVNNLLNETYAVSNTYVDLTLITAGTDDVMLLNEPGRYIYTNLDFKF